MIGILLAMCLMLAAGTPAYAADAPAKPAREAIHQDKKVIQQAYQTLDSDNQEIRALDKQRDEALRSNNPAAAKKIQAVIDQKRAALKKAQSALRADENDLQRQRRLAQQQCASDAACAKKRKQEVLTRQLDSLQRMLKLDQTAADRIPQDKAGIAKIEAELKQ